MTTVHLALGQSLSGLRGPARTASRSTPGVPHVFFQPVGHRVARHAEGARQPTQAAALVIGGENRLALLASIAVGLRLLAVAAPAVLAVVALFMIPCQTVADKVFAAAVVTG